MHVKSGHHATTCMEVREQGRRNRKQSVRIAGRNSDSLKVLTTKLGELASVTSTGIELVAYSGFTWPACPDLFFGGALDQTARGARGEDFFLPSTVGLPGSESAASF